MAIRNDVKLVDRYMGIMGKHWRDKGMLDWLRKSIGCLAELEDGRILLIKKPSIETRFCFGEHDWNYDEVLRFAHGTARTAGYFRHENLKGWDEFIKALTEKKDWDSDEVVLVSGYDKEVVEISLARWNTEGEKVSGKNREIVLGAVKRVRDDMEKRVNAYLKRYGTEKIRTWTYWADA